MEKEFCLDEYMHREISRQKPESEDEYERFLSICRSVEAEFDREWNETDDNAKHRKLEREKKAIMGSENETGFYKARIKEILRGKKLLDAWFPPWYPDITEGVFAELYGLAGLAPWAYNQDEKYVNSSSAKLIGDRLYCLIDGKSQLQPQTISKRRREQLKRTLLLATPHERLEYGFHEVYLHNGIRITIYSGERTKENQDVMVFRKYILNDLTFEKMVSIGTIPEGAEDLFKLMVKAGFNVIFAGQVRSGKTTFMQTWQKYENPELEGVAIATDPETPWHEIMPEAPIMQLTADGDELDSIIKPLLRGDNDYIILEEMRDAVAFNLALNITSTGTMRSKATIHDNDGINIPYKMASGITERFGGNLEEKIAEIYRNFDYALEFCQMPDDRSRKLMKGIVEYSYDTATDSIKAEQICRYDFESEKWLWNSNICKDKIKKIHGFEENFRQMKSILEKLEEENPIKEDKSIYPAYYRGGRHGECR